MQAKINIKCCKERPIKDIRGYGNICKKILCRRCAGDHMGHNIYSLEKFCEEKKKSVLSQISFEEISTQLKKRRDDTPKTAKKLLNEY